jgi:hypothetical protein
MPENWNYYLCRVNDRPASVFLDLAAGREGPREARPWLAWVWLRMQHPRDDGLSDRDEAEVLWKLEDAVVAGVTRTLDAQHVGRITSAGRREIYFYTAGPDPAPAVRDAAARALEACAAGYDYQANAKRDPAWSHYFDVMHPNPWEMHLIRNRGVLEALASHGDDLSVPRRVHHWIYFPTPAHRDAFAAVARERGFGTLRLDPCPEGTEIAFGLQAHRVDGVSQKAIDSVCHELFTLAQEHDGNYDGWETQVVKPGQTPTEDAPPPDDGDK